MWKYICVCVCVCELVSYLLRKFLVNFSLHVLYRYQFFFCVHIATLKYLQDKDLELCAVNLKLDQLEAELQDLNSQESKDETSLAKVFFPNQLTLKLMKGGL